MSNISTVYDALITRIGSLLTSYVRLPNPYRLDENNHLYLRNGYGIAIGPASRGTGFINCKIRIERQFIITLTKEYVAKDHSSSDKATIEKQIFEDQLLLIKDFESDPTVNGVANKVAYESDGGIEFIARNNEHFILVQGVFSVDYLENV